MPDVPDDLALIEAELCVVRAKLRDLARVMLAIHADHPQLPLPSGVPAAAVPDDPSDLLE